MAEEHPARAVRCSRCGFEFDHEPGKPPDPRLRGTPCPECGDRRKTYDMKPPPAVSRVETSLSRTSVGHVVKRNWWLIVVVIILGVLPAVLGFVFTSPWVNAGIGITCAAFSFWLGFKAAMTVRETTHH